MELTSLEKTYYDEFSKSFGKYGNGIPSEEWDRLSKVRKGLDITLKRSKEIIEAVQNHVRITESESANDANMLSIFKRGVMSLLRHHNNNDCLILNISDSDKGNVRNNFGLELDEQILWVRDTSFWSNKNQGLVITDKQIVYIPDNDKPDDRLNIEFNDIQHVEYREMSLFVWNYQNEYCQLGLGLFFKDTTESNELIADAKTLANVLTNMAKSVGHVETETVFDRMNSLMSEENYDEVVDCAKEVVSDVGNDNDTKCIAYMYLSEALSKKGEKDSHKGMNSYMRDAIEACDQAMELCEDEDPYRYTIFKQKGSANLVASYPYNCWSTLAFLYSGLSINNNLTVIIKPLVRVTFRVSPSSILVTLASVRLAILYCIYYPPFYINYILFGNGRHKVASTIPLAFSPYREIKIYYVNL